MRELFGCSLNGEEFLSIDPQLYIQDIREQVKMTAETANRPGGGKRLTGGVSRDELTVTILFMVKERNRAKRQDIISRVNRWATEGWLTVSTRPDQRLYVVRTQAADSAAFAWHEDMSIVFSTYNGAEWQDRYPVSASITGASGSASMIPRGTRDCPLDADITASGATVTSFTLTANGKQIAFSGLSIADGHTLHMYHDGLDLLHADVDGYAMLSHRTPASHDEIPLIPAQANTVSFSADGACAVKLYARGRYD